MILIATFKEMSGPFILEKLTQTLKRALSKVKTHRLYASDPEDCLIFNYEFMITAQVERYHMIGTVWEVQFTDEDFHIDLNQELYEECLERTRGVEGRGGMKKNLNRNKIFVSEQPLLEEP